MPLYEQTKNPELLRHISMHEYLKKAFSGEAPQQGGGQSMGTQGAAKPAPTEPELAGGFVSQRG